MSATEYYNHGNFPSTGSAGSSSAMRAELEAIETGFGLMPDLSGNGSKIVAVNSGGSALEAITTTGTGNGVRATSPTLVTPTLGVATATSINGLTITSSTGTLTITNGKTLSVSNTLTFTGTDASSVAFGTGGTVAYTSMGLGSFAATTSAELAGVISDETGSGALVFANTPTLVTPVLGTPTSGTLTNCTGLPISTGVSGLGANIATFLATPSSANLASAVTDETGTGALVFANTPTLVTPVLGTPTSGTLTNCDGLPISTGVSGLASGIATFLATPSSLNLKSAVTDETGSGSLVFATSPTLVTPTLGVATATSINGLTLTSSTGTFTLTNGKTLSVSNTLTLAGTDGTTMTFPTTSATLARTDAGNTFTGAQVINASSGSALTVTNTGSGNSLLIEDSASTDSTPFVITANGTVLQGYTASYGLGSGAQFSAAGVSIQTFSASATAYVLDFEKSRGAQGAQGIVSNADNIGGLRFSGSDGTNSITAAQIIAAVDGTPGTNDMPGRLVFSTTADGASSVTERMRIDAAGGVGIGTSAAAGRTVQIGRTMTGATSTVGVRSDGSVQSDVTTEAVHYQTVAGTAAAAFTLANLTHFQTNQTTIGAGSAVTNQFGFLVASSLTGATNNYGFYGNIPSGTGRYNLYMNGTAQNYLAGELGIGIAPSSTTQLATAASTTAKSSARIPHGAAPTSPVDGDVWTTTSGLFIRINGVTKTVTLT